MMGALVKGQKNWISETLTALSEISTPFLGLLAAGGAKCTAGRFRGIHTDSGGLGDKNNYW